jgi:hypothetical protein
MIHFQNITIGSSYSVWGTVGKGRMRIYNYSIYNDTNQAFTGLTGTMSYNGFSWYADVPVSALPEGNYYINAFFKDKSNDTVTTANSSVFTVQHTIDLSSLVLEYTGELVQELEIIVAPVSTYEGKGSLDDTETLTKTYLLYPYNESTPLNTGTLIWNGINWSTTIDVSHYPEKDYFVQIIFADTYDNVTQNSSLASVYHYIGITPPLFQYNASSKLLDILNIVATSSYHGIVNDSNVVPTIKSYTIVASQIGANLTGNLTYSSPWHQTNIDLSSLWYSSNFTIIITFEVNESFGTAIYELLIPPKQAPTLNAISPNPDDDGSVYLDWDDVDGATIYYIYRNTINVIIVGASTPIAVVSTSSYQDIVESEGSYYYVIVAGNAAGNTSASNMEDVAMDFPGGGIPGFEMLFLSIGIFTILVSFHRKRTNNTIMDRIGA